MDFGWVAWVEEHSILVFLILVAIATIRIVATYQVFSETADEPAHIACGMEWLSKGTFQYEPKHPPLARVATALGPYLYGARSHGISPFWEEGLAILSREHHDRNLALARVGILPFFWLACVVVYLWSKRYLREPGPTLAVLSFTVLPPVLAHAGLATTDLPLAALVGASFFTAIVWVNKPTWRNSIVFGVATGLAVLTKFTALPFIPVSFVAAIAWYFVTRRPKLSLVRKVFDTHLGPFCIAVLAGFVAIWAGYRFSFGTPPFTHLPMPAPELYIGIQQAMAHAQDGHPAFLLGEQSRYGWWYYYLVALAVKTPLPFLALLACGAFLRKHSQEENLGIGLALAFSIGILLFSFANTINIGVRHILPVYIGFSVVVGAGAVHLLGKWKSSPIAAGSLGFLLLWLLTTSALAHPDYLPYFNALAGNTPERILVDSDLDWGQDLKRLAKRLHEVGATEVFYYPFFSADLDAIGLPPLRSMNAVEPTPGWHAVSLTALKAQRLGFFERGQNLKFWAERIPPDERIGKGIWLWHFQSAVVPKG